MVYPGMSLSSRQKPKGFCKDSITTASKQPRMNKNIKFSPIAKKRCSLSQVIHNRILNGWFRMLGDSFETFLPSLWVTNSAVTTSYQSTWMHTCTAGDIQLLVFMCPDASSFPFSSKRAAVWSSKHCISAHK